MILWFQLWKLNVRRSFCSFIKEAGFYTRRQKATFSCFTNFWKLFFDCFNFRSRLTKWRTPFCSNVISFSYNVNWNRNCDWNHVVKTGAFFRQRSFTCHHPWWTSKLFYVVTMQQSFIFIGLIGIIRREIIHLYQLRMSCSNMTILILPTLLHSVKFAYTTILHISV